MRQLTERLETPQRPQSRFEHSVILSEGLARMSRLRDYEKPLYMTWNSVPIKYSLSIALELGGALANAGFSRHGRADYFDLRPNYPGLRFTPLEMSFARRPDGAANFVKDMLQGRPYRLLSEIRDGCLYSPDGGGLQKVFPKTMRAMLGDMFTLAILKSARLGYLVDLVREYDETRGFEKMADGRIFRTLRGAGARNTKMFYLFGFRDSQAGAAGEIITATLGAGWERADVMARSAGPDSLPQRGPKGAGKWEADTGFSDALYEFREPCSWLAGRHQERYLGLDPAQRTALDRIFAIREELVQESGLTLGSIEYCRGVFYEAANELGARLASRNALVYPEDVWFLTVAELSEALKRAGVDQRAVGRRKDRWESQGRPGG